MADVNAGAMYLRVANNLKRPVRAPDSDDPCCVSCLILHDQV
ncbi:hypothetical protein PAST3_08641 [Cutibacterium acnes HL201PA1]|nr:hypothetical protein PAST3_08641 [Cutibacterium acnes HL201PA1]